MGYSNVDVGLEDDVEDDVLDDEIVDDNTVEDEATEDEALMDELMEAEELVEDVELMGADELKDVEELMEDKLRKTKSLWTMRRLSTTKSKETKS